MHEEIIDFIEDMSFPDACNDICATNTGILSVGTYKPTMKQFCTVKNLMIMERHSVSELIKCEHIEDDKFCVLRDDKTVEFYKRHGLVEKVKFDNTCYDLKFFEDTIFVATSKGIECLNLKTGEKHNLKGIEDKIYKLKFNYQNGLLGCLAEEFVGFYDIKNSEYICKIEGEYIDFDTRGNVFSLLENKQCVEYDFRNISEPKNIFETNNNLRLICYKEEDYKIVIDDKYIHFNNEDKVEIDFKVNACCVFENYLFIGGETEKIRTYKLN